jgi:hypothetical protein
MAQDAGIPTWVLVAVLLALVLSWRWALKRGYVERLIGRWTRPEHHSAAAVPGRSPTH